MKIRIGNDIRLDVTLISTSVIDSVNIKSVEAFIINATKEAEAQEEALKKTRFISRFPLEPYINAYTSTANNINSTGFPTYRAYPNDHVIASYSGFGPGPKWNDIYRPIPKHNYSQYKAQVKATSVSNVVLVYFPAEQQFFVGDYNLVIVAKIYEPGYADNNLRTVSMDYENVFTLVNTSEEGVDSDITIQIGGDHGRIAAESVEMSGATQANVGYIGIATAKVLPETVFDSTVSWQVDSAYEDYIHILNYGGNSCKYKIVALPPIKSGTTTINVETSELSFEEGLYVGTIPANTVFGENEVTVNISVEGYIPEKIYDNIIVRLTKIKGLSAVSILEFNSSTGLNTAINSNTNPTLYNEYLSFIGEQDFDSIKVIVYNNHTAMTESNMPTLNIITTKVSTDSYSTVKLKAISNQTPSVYGELSINVYPESDGDIHLTEGTYQNGALSLKLTNNKNVDVDLSQMVDWYEGN